MRETFAGRLRVAAQKVGEGGREFTVMDLVDAMGIQDMAGKRRVWESIRDFVRYGEWERVGKGTYRITGKPRAEKPTEKRRVMWNYMRMKRQRGEFFTVDDLVEISGAGVDWAKEWVRGLVTHGSVRDYGNGKFRMVSVKLEMPDLDEKAEKLRELRARRRQALKNAALSAHDMLTSLMAAIKVDGQMDLEA